MTPASTPSAAAAPPRTAASPIAPNTTATTTTNPNASASVRAGFLTRGGLDHVDGHVDDDPHDVDEVPVEAGDLDAEVVVRLWAEVAADRADEGEEEQVQPDEDVHPV